MLFKSIFSRQMSRRLGNLERDWPTGSPVTHAQSFFSSVTTQSRSQSFVPLDQRSENESSGSIHFEITMGNNRILVIRFTAQSQSASISCYGACLKWLLPELSFSDRWSRGTKLWERDWSPRGTPPCWIDSHSTLRANVT